VPLGGGEREERIRGGILGMLVGDALGVPYEFHDPANLPPREQLEMVPPENFRRAHHGTPPGTWSDDGAQALCLLASLLHNDGLDVGDLGRRFVDWYHHGYMAVDKRVFDIGNATSAALIRIEQGWDPAHAGGTDEQSNGNGALMRVLPLALWHQGSDGDLVDDAQAQARVTHGHERSQVCCALYCLWARRVLAGEPLDAAWDDATAKLARLYRRRWRGQPRYLAELEETILPYPEHHTPSGTGYVLDALFSARVALREPSYEGCVKAAIAFGLDTDTTACIAGGIAGLRAGSRGIPVRWVSGLRGIGVVEELFSVWGVSSG